MLEFAVLLAELGGGVAALGAFRLLTHVRELVETVKSRSQPVELATR
jgi:hypothetical protein